MSLVIIGAGPCGLMAAEILAAAGKQVAVYDRMPNPARKFLIAGRGGLNLTHSEQLDTFISRYGAAADWLAPSIKAFPPEDLIKWCEALGQKTFVGSSGRVFPRSMKAASILRAWLKRLENLGVSYHPRHTWQGWEGAALKFSKLDEAVLVNADATLLALGGASWPRLGSDGSWVDILKNTGVEVVKLLPSNSGFITSWSEHFSSRFAGTPLKPVSITHNNISRQGEIMITASGMEGGAVYALSSAIRDEISAKGLANITLDLRPDMALEALDKKLQGRRGNKSLSTYLRSAGFPPVAISLLREAYSPAQLESSLAEKLKSLPITLTATTGIERAISSAGGITRNAVNDDFMLTARPGVFAAGEMLDWEAPTGGYLLQGCYSTAFTAAHGILRYLG